jgi:mannose-6-phosphate isomerase-like protein (cupin superfamily)
MLTDKYYLQLSGRIGYVLNGKEFLGSAGDVVTIPRGATHTVRALLAIQVRFRPHH